MPFNEQGRPSRLLAPIKQLAPSDERELFLQKIQRALALKVTLPSPKTPVTPQSPPEDPQKRQEWEKKQAWKAALAKSPPKAENLTNPIQIIRRSSLELDIEKRMKQQQRLIEAYIQDNKLRKLILFIVDLADKNIPLQKEQYAFKKKECFNEADTAKKEELLAQLRLLDEPDSVKELKTLFQFAMTASAQHQDFQQRLQAYQDLDAIDMVIKTYVDHAFYTELLGFIFQDEGEVEIRALLDKSFTYCREKNIPELEGYRGLPTDKAIIKYYIDSNQKDKLCNFIFKQRDKVELVFSIALSFDKGDTPILEEMHGLSWTYAFLRHLVNKEDQKRLISFIFESESEVKVRLEEAIRYCSEQHKETLIEEYKNIEWRTAFMYFIVEGEKKWMLPSFLHGQGSERTALLREVIAYSFREQTFEALEFVEKDWALGKLCAEEIISYYVDNLPKLLSTYVLGDVQKAESLFPVMVSVCAEKQKLSLLKGYDKLTWQQAVVRFQINIQRRIDRKFAKEHLSTVLAYAIQHTLAKKQQKLLEPIILDMLDEYWVVLSEEENPNHDFMGNWLSALPFPSERIDEIKFIFQSVAQLSRSLARQPSHKYPETRTAIRAFHSVMRQEISGLFLAILARGYTLEMYRDFIIRCKDHVKKSNTGNPAMPIDIYTKKEELKTFLKCIEETLSLAPVSGYSAGS
ncbi:MAG: hypothetical protein Q8R79_03935 [Legionellaceae bacterium]|nr:hypothetical protein [Legionellaceae bacterium]